MTMRTLYKVNAVIQTSLLKPGEGDINHNKAGSSAFQEMHNNDLFMKRYGDFINVTSNGGFGGSDRTSHETLVKLAYAGSNVNGKELIELKTDINAFQHFLEKFHKSWLMRKPDMSSTSNLSNDNWFKESIEKCKRANSSINSMLNVLEFKSYDEEEKKVAFETLNDIPADAWNKVNHEELEEEEDVPF